MRIPIDRDSRTPLYQQIQAFLQEQIQSGVLPPEARLPATRELAERLDVSRITVTNAYAELEAAGLVYTQVGSGTFVAPPLATSPEPGDGPTAADDWPLWQQRVLTQTWLPAHRELGRLARSVSHPDMISLTGGIGDSQLFPAEDFRKTLQQVLRRDGEEALGYGDPAGYPPLRTLIAHILASNSIPARPEHILITSGSQQAMALVGHLLLRPGDVVLVESPTYVGAIDLFRSLDVRLLGVPVDERGMQSDHVENALRTAQPKLIYTIPTFQNPTGTCMSGQRRRQLIALADRYNVPILEDDFVGDLRYAGRVQPALKALDPGGRVVYISTFSKALMPGVRVGFMVAEGPVYDWLLACKRVTDLATSNPVQRALEAYITVGKYQAHLRRVCRLYQQRLDAMGEALERYMPLGTRWHKPDGGLFMWVQLPDGLSSNALYPIAGEEGVTFLPGSFCFPGERPQSYMRLNFVMNTSEAIEEGVRRLARAVKRLMAQDEREAPLPPGQGTVRT